MLYFYSLGGRIVKYSKSPVVIKLDAYFYWLGGRIVSSPIVIKLDAYLIEEP